MFIATFLLRCGRVLQIQSHFLFSLTVYDSPDVKYVNRFVRATVCADPGKWWDLGIELLNADQKDKLNVIKANGGSDTKACFNKMIELWLQTKPDACWKQLVQALSCVELNTLARKINILLLQSADDSVSYTDQQKVHKNVV